MKRLEADFKKTLKNFKLNMQFELEKGCLGILGASGCGKSMTLKAVAGIVTPDCGRICTEKAVFYDSAAKKNLPPQKRKVGYLFQNYALFPNMSVAENIAAGIRGGSDARHRYSTKELTGKVRLLAEQFQLESVLDQYPSRLSGGQQQRTALARILGSQPDILLLDEPFSAMDSYLKEELQLELHDRLKEFPGCCIIVSHDRDEIYKLCSHTMVMDKGRNLICKETEALFEQPQYVQAARLTGCKNISRARQTGLDRVEALDWGVEFYIDRAIPKQLSYIGIRAHDFIPVSGDTQGKKNLIRILPGEIAEAPFEWTLLFQNARNPKGHMWMKRQRGDTRIPKMVYVEPGKLLLLEEQADRSTDR